MSDRGAYRATSTDPRERGARCDEYLEVMTTLWTGSTDRFRGRYFEFDDIEMSPRSVQQPHPPIWAGGGADGMLRRTARACQGFVPVASGLGTRRQCFRGLSERVRDHGGAMQCLGAPGGRASYRIPAERAMEIGADLDSSELQAILIPDTAIAVFRAASQLEDSLGKSVISANQATLWDVLRLAGSDQNPQGFGRLLSGHWVAA